jgi:hypothetical protein
MGGGACVWPFPTNSDGRVPVRVYAKGRLGQVDIEEAADSANKGWNNVCGIHMHMHANPRTAHIRMTTGSIDGPSGTLGWSELPCGFSAEQWKQVTQKYDVDERWVIAINPPSDRIDAVRVVMHELGHGIGISHISDGNLMAPMYSDAIYLPQRGDTMEAIYRYGSVPSAHDPVPDPIPPLDPGETDDSPPTDIGWGDLLPCLSRWGFDVIGELTPKERKQLVKCMIGAWRGLTPKERKLVRRLTEGHDDIHSVVADVDGDWD